MLLVGTPRTPFFSIVLFSAVAIGAYGFLPVFMSVPSEFLTGFSAAAGIALVVSISNFGGFVGPYTVGLIRQKTGSSHFGLICAGISFLLSAVLASLLRNQSLSTTGQTEAITTEEVPWPDPTSFKKGGCNQAQPPNIITCSMSKTGNNHST
jgi:nitrate/nitrite transporter NarK